MGRDMGMGRALHRLSDPEIKQRRKSGYYADGGCLYLRIAPGGTKGWIFRYTLNGRTRDAGLGSVADVTLKKARQEAKAWRELIEAGTDPIEARERKRAEAELASAKAMTFEQCAKAYIASHEPSWRNDKHRAQWRSTLATYCYPVLGTIPVGAIDTALVLMAVEPIWAAKPETASRVRGRVEVILNWAKARGHRDGDNPARWRGHLDQLLPAKAKVRRVEHHSALPYREIPAFMARLRKLASSSARSLEFLVLTATRTSEGLGATWDEVDLRHRMWTIPASRMKGGKEHRVPLTSRTLAIVKEMAEVRQSDFIFPGAKEGRPLSNMALLMLVRDLRPGITVHGFRSTFKDWAAECTTSPNFVSEAALAHVVADRVEAAYRRGDLFEKRRQLMEEWGAYCCGKSNG
jgi:integrase